MTPLDEPHDPELAARLAQLSDVPARDPQAAAAGRAHYLAQARELAPAVSRPGQRRHSEWYVNLIERNWRNMKTRVTVVGLVMAVAVVAVVALLARNVTTVSAEQVLQRAAAAQAAGQAATPGATGVWHTRIQIYDNPRALAGDHPGSTRIMDDFIDLASGFDRRVTTDAAGHVLEASSQDKATVYSTHGPVAAGSPVTIFRLTQSPDPRKGAPGGDPTALSTAMFDSFRSNPRVTLDGKITRPDGRQAYVLVEPNFQSQQGSSATLTGAMKMVFDTQTYQWLESTLTTHQGDQDIVIQQIEILADELLPASTRVAWDLSDLHGVAFADEQPAAQPTDAPLGTITRAELAKHAHTLVLKTVPAGDTETIYAQPGQPADQPYAYEIHYTHGDQDFNLQAVGIMAPGFIAQSFYDGSYKTASGLVINYSPARSDPGAGASGMLTTLDGYSFLIGNTGTRAELQALAEALVAAQ